MVMKIRKALNYVLTIVLVTTLLMIGTAPVAADSGASSQLEPVEGPGTPMQHALKTAMEERLALGLPVPSLVSYEHSPSSVLTAAGNQEITITGKTIIYFASPEEAGFDKWPNLIIEDLGPDGEGNVFAGGDYTQFVRDRLEVNYPGIWDQYDFDYGAREYVFEENLKITYRWQALLATSTSTSVNEILMGLTYLGPEIDYTWRKYYNVDIPLYGTLTVYDVTAGFALDWALGLRLPLEVGLTSPDPMDEGSTYWPNSYVNGLDWSAADFQQVGVPLENGNEFVLRFYLFAGLKLILVDVNVLPDWSNVEVDIDMSKSFKTPFGPGESFPIPDINIPLWSPSFGVGWLDAGLLIDPVLGSNKITAEWQASGDASGNGDITYTSPGSAVTLGPVDANDFSPSKDYANLTLSGFSYWFNQFLINLSVSFGLGVDIVIYSDYFNLGSIPIYTLDLSDLTGSLSVGVHEGTPGTVTKDILVQNVAPVVNAGPDATVDEGSTFSRSGSFTDPGTDTWEATVDYGDGSGVKLLTLKPDKTFDLNHIYADNGTYTVTVTVTDDDGGVGTDTAAVTVNNVAPTLDAGPGQNVDEGDIVSLAPATFNDKGTLDTHTATINWGDGTSTEAGSVTESPFGPPGSTAGMNGTVSGSHVYADNGTYTVTVTITDDDGGMSTDTTVVTVNNVAPTLDAGPDQEATAAYIVSLAPATFNDKGTLDTHTATINWGDGTSTEAGSVTESPFGPPGSTAGMNGTVSGSHIYLVSGEYTVLVTVTDDNGGSIQDTLTVTVKPFPVSIDIKPGNNPNSINLNSKGGIPVAILTTPEFDASLVVAGSIRFGPRGAPPVHYQLEDVDKDGDLDLILHFKTSDTGIETYAIEASITGYSYDPFNRLLPPTVIEIKGTDSVRIVPPKGKK